MKKWINVKDQLPEQLEHVIVTDGEEVLPSILDENNEFMCLHNRVFAYAGITYWMYLPEPPKEIEL